VTSTVIQAFAAIAGAGMLDSSPTWIGVSDGGVVAEIAAAEGAAGFDSALALAFESLLAFALGVVCPCAAVGLHQVIDPSKIIAAIETHRTKGCRAKVTELIIKKPPSKEPIIGNPLPYVAFDTWARNTLQCPQTRLH
jgi:hypothetical protein